MRSELIPKLLLGLPKSLYINFRYFNIKDAIKLPIIVSYKTKFLKLSGSIEIKGKIKPGMIKIGLEGSGTCSCYPTILELNGHTIFEGVANIGGDCKIVTVSRESVLYIGNNVNITGGTLIISRKKVDIGKRSLISWDCQIMDTDFHEIKINSNQINKDKGITIGSNVWIGSKCNILKGVTIGNNNVIASGAIINKNVDFENCVVTGSPIKVLRKNIEWTK